MGYQTGQVGMCPHCKVKVRFEPVRLANPAIDASNLWIVTPNDSGIGLIICSCSNCGKFVLTLSKYRPYGRAPVQDIGVMIWPDSAERPIPPAVESDAPQLAADFKEAAAVFPKSKKASAALSRRCLQFILREKGGATKRDLADQIEEVLPKLPTDLALNVDAIRHVGNFAAHPLKSKSTGEIVEVEEGEAEWLLDVLEELFEHYYVAPAAAAERRAALNKKLADLGKPPLKEP